MAETDKIKASLTMAFASPILRLQVPDAAGLNDTLISEARALRDRSGGVRKSNRQGWHSENDLMTRTEPGLSKLAVIIRQSVHYATRAIAPDFVFADHQMAAEGWININPQHGYNVPHRHGGFMWSGCYYVSVPDPGEAASGSIEFLAPHSVPSSYSIFGAGCYQDNITLRPNAGDLLLFPSYLLHWVLPNEADAERITIAFNATYQRK
jgi:uncharacterized protein (TIGR02466 family)